MSNEMIIGAVMSLMSGVFWFWVKSLNKRIDKNDSDIERIKHDYQRRDDAHRDAQMLKDMMTAIQASLNRIDQKLDRKADK